MKPSILYLLPISMLTACNVSSGSLNVPDAVTINRQGKHQQIPGTRIFMVKPLNYKVLPREYRLQKDRTTFIEMQETSIGYKWRREAIMKTFEETRAKGLPLYFHKEFKLGNDSAFILYGKGETPAKDEIVLTFGDSNYLVMAGSEMPAGDEKARKEILASLLSMYVDTLAKPDYTAFADFLISLSGTSFRFDSYDDHTFYYTPDGEGLTYNDPFDTEIMVKSIPPMHNIKEKKSYADSMIKIFSDGHMAITNWKERVVKIDGKDAYEISYENRSPVRPIRVYQIVTGSVYFRGFAYDKEIGLASQFEKIAKTLR